MVAEIPGFGDGHTFRKRDGRFGGQPFFEILVISILKISDTLLQNSGFWTKSHEILKGVAHGKCLSAQTAVSFSVSKMVGCRKKSGRRLLFQVSTP